MDQTWEGNLATVDHLTYSLVKPSDGDSREDVVVDAVVATLAAGVEAAGDERCPSLTNIEPFEGRLDAFVVVVVEVLLVVVAISVAHFLVVSST